MLHLPIDLRAKLDLRYYSEVEKQVPDGTYTRLFSQLTREHLEWHTLELKPFGFPEGYFVRGPKEMIEKLKSILTQAAARAA